ncbi:MAG: hypothetical protein IKO52_00810 [Clostridia bacterium]|nr:hypothetical protein [Clostridia bacterium]
MIQVDTEDLCSTEIVCGIWINHGFSKAERALHRLLNSIHLIRCVAFCGIGEISFQIEKIVQNIKVIHPYLRVAIIGNAQWYNHMPCLTQNKLLRLLDEADFFIPCPFPIEDALVFLSYCSDYLIVDNCEPFFDYVDSINEKRKIKVYRL